MTLRTPLSPGMALGRYELLLPIAQGGMATVWAARLKGSRGFAKTVAIKTMLPMLSDDPTFEEMFLAEAQLAARIHHPNVAEILDLGEHDDTLFIVMEWVDGEPLNLLLKTARKIGAQVPLRVTLRIATQICAGLHAAHELCDEGERLIGVVHRDVSPQNILISRDGLVKLVDFGIAKAVSRAGATTGAGTVKGKVPYLAPEQIRGKPVDRRTDIFALGVILYRLTTGTHPFLGDTDSHTMRNIVSRPAMPPHVKQPSYCRSLEQVIMRCLQKDPDKRFDSMAAVERALEAVMIEEIGGLVPPEEVTFFVRTLLGDREQKRRAALRDAARAIDDKEPLPEGELLEIPDEDVSGLLLTETITPTHSSAAPESSDPSVATPPGTPTPVTPLSGGTPGFGESAGAPTRPSSTNLTASLVQEGVDVRPKRLAPLWVALAVGALVIGAVVLSASDGDEVTLGAPARSPAPSVTAAPERPAQVDADARSETHGSGASAVKVEDLPSADEGADAPSRRGRPSPRSGSARPAPAPDPTHEPAPSASLPASSPGAAVSSAPPPPPPPPPSEQPWVPTVQNPGF